MLLDFFTKKRASLADLALAAVFWFFIFSAQYIAAGVVVIVGCLLLAYLDVSRRNRRVR